MVSYDDPAAAPVLSGLDEEYRAEYGALIEDEIGLYEADEFVPPHGVFLVYEAHGRTIAGGALRRLAEGIGEIKRMWTAPEHRGRGHARRVLAALEDTAVVCGYRVVRLQTGALQSAALALYRSAGYRPTAQYGRYVGDPRLVCLEKVLAAPGA
jgi:ribosomal protein S18 acetylase RimI-like enzyme